MLKRKIDHELKLWSAQKNKKCMLVRGARQVGKTTSVRVLGGDYRSFIEVNFLKTPSLKAIFSGDLDIETLLFNFSLYMPEAAFIPGKTLLFLDEIQECPDAVTSLKFWAEDGSFDVIASGSMLGIDYNRPGSYPVGYMDYLDMKALSFEEFLWASGIADSTIEVLHGLFDSRSPVPYALHEKMMQYLRRYTAVGGMPDAVNAFLDDNSALSCHDRQQDILKDYRYDIAHYAPPEIKLKAEKCYFSLPEQLSKDNHKFKYSVIEKGGNARKFQTSIDWIINADLVFLCRNLKGTKKPLKSGAEDNNFRIYPTDIGLLTAMYDYNIKKALIQPDTGYDISRIKGGIYEALIADILYKNGWDDVFFRKNEQATFELEFIIENADGVIPIEVKSANSRSKSLDNILENADIPYGYKLIDGNIGVSGKKITMPLYMAMFIRP